MRKALAGPPQVSVGSANCRASPALGCSTTGARGTCQTPLRPSALCLQNCVNRPETTIESDAGAH